MRAIHGDMLDVIPRLVAEGVEVEREEQYYNDIRERLALYEGSRLHSSQAKGRNRKVEHGPLFGAAE